jgi:hypothetical protein
MPQPGDAGEEETFELAGALSGLLQSIWRETGRTPYTGDCADEVLALAGAIRKEIKKEIRRAR